MKTCTKCGEQKAESEFYKDRADCKSCSNKRSKVYSETHRQQILDYHAKYNKEHPFREWYQKHKAERAHYHKKYRQQNIAKMRAHEKKYREENRAKIRAYANKHYHSDAVARKKHIIRILARAKVSLDDHCIISIDCDGPLEHHHPNYEKPLETYTLCRKHHRMLHNELMERAGK